MTRRHARSGWLSLAVLGLSACAPAAVARRIASVAETTQRAVERDARRCAPQELALAEAHLAFARMELKLGEPGQADRHLTLAEPNAKAALWLSRGPICAHASGAVSIGSRAGADRVTPRAAYLNTSSRLLGAVGTNRSLVRGGP